MKTAQGPHTALTSMLSLALVVFPLTSIRATLIDTTQSGSTTEHFFGDRGDFTDFYDNDSDGIIDEGDYSVSHTVGQTFVVPAGAGALTAFRFYLRDDPYTPVGTGEDQENPVQFRGYIMQWDAANGHATGSVLYQSSGRVTTDNGLRESFEFDTGQLNLAAGTPYVAFVNLLDYLETHYNNTSVVLGRSSAPGGTYSGGSLVSATDGALTFAALGTDAWSVFANEDVEFQAFFASAAVPEPAVLLLTLLGGYLLRWRWHHGGR